MWFFTRHRPQREDAPALGVILKEIRKLANQVETLNTLLDGISTQVGVLATETNRIATEQATLVADLKAATSQGTPVDITATIAKAQSISDALNAQTANLRSAADAMQTAITAANPPTPAAPEVPTETAP